MKTKSTDTIDLSKLTEILQGDEMRTVTLPITLPVFEWYQIAEHCARLKTTPAKVIEMWIGLNDCAATSVPDMAKLLVKEAGDAK